MKLRIIGLIFFLCFIPTAYAQDENQRSLKPATTNVTKNIELEQLFIIKADEADYNEKDGYLIASGNVSLSSGQTVTQTDHIFYDLENEVLKINGSFIIKSLTRNIASEDLRKEKKTKKECKSKNTATEDVKEQEVRDYLRGVSLNYNLKTEKGSAKNVDSRISGIYFSGKHIKFTEKKIIVSYASFTNCPHTPKHYALNPRSLHIYSETGMVVIRGTVLRLFRIPIFYLPNYVYGGAQGSAASQTPIPDIGSDDVRGTYVREKVGYHFGGPFTGTINLEWSKNLGWGTGINNSYVLNDRLHGDFRLNYAVNSGWEGGLKNNFILWQNKKEDVKQEDNIITDNVTESSTQDTVTKDAKESKGIFNKFFTSFSPRGGIRKIRLSIEASNHELVNYQRISYRPQLELDMPTLTVPYMKTSIKINGGWGKIKEESTLTTTRSFIHCDIKQTLIPAKYLGLSMSLSYNNYGYGQGSYWEKLSGSVDISKAIKYLSWNLGYLRMFRNAGSSPFNFDKYQATENDEVYLGVNLGSTSSIGINFYYDLGNKNYRYKEYKVVLALCKWRLKVSWEDVGNNIGLGLSLTH